MSAFGTSLHANRWKPGAVRRILLLKTDHLGDFLLCLPAVRDFLRAQSGAEIEAVVGNWTRPLAERVPWISAVRTWDSPRYVRSGPASSDRELARIMDRGYDLVIDLTNDPACALSAFRRPSRFRLDVGSFRLRQKAARLFGGGTGLRETHVSHVFYRALGLAVPTSVVPEPLALRDEDRERAVELLSRAWPGDRPIAALHAGASWEFRRWPPARFRQLTRELEERGLSVVLVGGPNDREVSDSIGAGAGLAPERVLAGTCDLPVTAAVLERAAVLVANDGGLVHLAAAQGTPVIAIHGPQDPALFGPLGERSRALYRKRDCSPCSQQHCVWGRARCLEPIEADEVLREALEAVG